MALLINPFKFAAAGPSDNPVNYPSLVRDWRSDAYSLPDGTTISADWTGANGMPNAVLTGSPPVFRTAQFGSMPAIRFSAPQYFTHPALVLAGDFTIAIVTVQGGDFIFLSNSSGNYQVRRCQSGGDNLAFHPNAATVTANYGVGVITDPRVSVWRRSAGVMDFRVNKTTFAGGATSDTMNTNQLGLADGGPDDGWVGEVCIWTSVLSDANLDALYDNYFKMVFTNLP